MHSLSGDKSVRLLKFKFTSISDKQNSRRETMFIKRLLDNDKLLKWISSHSKELLWLLGGVSSNTSSSSLDIMRFSISSSYSHELPLLDKINYLVSFALLDRIP